MAINAYSWAKDGEKNLSPSFKVREFRCSDNTDPIFIDSELVEILQKIRNHFGKPVNITSGFRTASKNATIKNAAKFSQHLYGKAADIWISGVTVEQIAAYAETLLPNRGGIGRYPKEGHADRTHGWVHIDTRAAKSRWVSYFYPRPPRGGRQQKQRQNLYFLINYTTFCTNLEEP